MIEDRTVSFLELFYDLVYVVLIGQIAHTLAEDVSWSGVLDFAVVFGLIWIGWFNGAQFHELHGREDGRNRSFIFLQMGILTVLAVFTGHAASTDGEAFALTYAVLLAVLVWQWASVYRTDAPEYRPGALRYLAGLVVSIGALLASSGMEDAGRLAVWAAVVVGSIALVVVYMLRTSDDSLGIRATDSMAERYGLFIIIVLGEVVVGVVDGLLAVEDLDFRTVATGVLGLSIAFGFWWTYFDYVGRRLPRQDGGSLVLWLYSQLPIALAVAAFVLHMPPLAILGDTGVARSVSLVSGSCQVAAASQLKPLNQGQGAIDSPALVNHLMQVLAAAAMEPPAHGVRRPGRRGSHPLRGAPARGPDRGRHALYAQDSVEECWRVLQPLLDHPPLVHPYQQGSWGPPAADQLVAAAGGWRGPWVEV